MKLRVIDNMSGHGMKKWILKYMSSGPVMDVTDSARITLYYKILHPQKIEWAQTWN